MKKLGLLVMALAPAAFAFEGSETGVNISAVSQQVSQQLVFNEVATSQQAGLRDLINWQIGDYHKLKVEIFAGFGGQGTKTVTKEESVEDKAAVWYVTEIALMGQNQKTETLIRRSDAKVLRLIVNGQEQDPNQEQDMEIIEQGETNITVPAGSFDCMYIKAKVRAQGQEMTAEIWANPIDVNLDGMLKMKVSGGMVPLTMTLTEFGKR